MKQKLLSKWSIIFLALVALVMSSLLLTWPAQATEAVGLHPTPIVSGNLSQTIRAKFMGDKGGFGDGTDVKTITMVKYVLDPGGTFGWHQHGGPVWAVVSAGTLSIYDGDDPTCTPQKFGPGNAFLDPGDHTHIGVNETAAPVEVYVTFMLPEGGKTRLDAEDPGLCK